MVPTPLPLEFSPCLIEDNVQHGYSLDCLLNMYKDLGSIPETRTYTCTHQSTPEVGTCILILLLPFAMAVKKLLSSSVPQFG